MRSVADPGSRVVRVFISSTFRDFEQERNLLATDVFPELRRRARDRFVEVMEVDLRWGITQEQSEQGLTLPICLKEIERARPYFIGLLGERYGWTPTSGQYSELLLDQHAWLKEHMGGISVTELEILHGVLRDLAMAGRAYFYFRDPAYSADRGPDFRSEGAHERAKLDSLKSRIRSSQFPVVEYATPKEVAQRIIDDLWSLIDAQYPADEVPDELERDRRSHESYAADRRRVHVGQEATVAALLGRLESEDAQTRLTVVTGESGTGKSALLANVLAQYLAKHPDDQVIAHYLAAGYGAADPAKILRRLAAEIKRFTGTLKEIEESDDLLMQQLAEWLAEASAWAQQAGRSVIIALDGLDKLDGSRSLAWLPGQMPPHVRVVVSTLAGESLDALRKRGEVELAAQPFSKESARNYVIEALEKRRGKHLPAREIERIIAHPRSTLPLFLKTLVDELSVYGSFDGLPGRISQCLATAEPDDLFEVILARLEDDMGRDKVQKPMEAIWAAPNGLSDAELVGFTGVTPLELARVKLALGDALHEDRGMVMPAHDYLRKGIKDRYLDSDELVSELHHRLGAWWELQEASGRMGRAVDFHYFRADAWDDLERCLLDVRVGGAILGGVTTHGVFKSWQAIANARGAQATSVHLEQVMSPVWERWKAAEDERRTLLVRFNELSGLLEMAGALGLGLTVVRHNLEIARALVESQGTPQSLRDLGIALMHVADIERSRGQVDEAYAKFLEDLTISRQLAQQIEDPQSLRDLGIALSRVADIERSRGQVDEAYAKFLEDLTISRQLAQQIGNPQSLRDLGIALSRVADIELSRGQVDEAYAKFLEDLTISRQLAQQIGNPENLRDLGIALSCVADIERSRGQVDEAYAKYLEELTIFRQLAQQIGNPQSLRDLGVALRRVADIERSRGQVDEAYPKCLEDLTISRQLAQQIGNPESLRNLGGALTHVANIELSRGQVDEAYAKCLEVLKIFRQLAQQIGNPENLRNLGFALSRVADIERSRGQVDEAYARFLERLTISRQLAQQIGNPESLRNLGFALSRVADIERSRGRVDEAYARFLERLTISRQLAQQIGDPESQRDLGSALMSVADIELSRGRVDEAYAKFLEGLKISHQLAQQIGDPESQRDLGSALMSVADIERSRGQVDEAYAKYLEVLKIFRQLAQQIGNPESLRDLSVSLNQVVWTAQLLAERDLGAGNATSALARLDSALSLAEELLQSTDADILDTAAVYWERRSEVLNALNQSSLAEECRSRAKTIRDRIASL